MPKISKHPQEHLIKYIDKRFLRQEWRSGIYHLVDARNGKTLTTSTMPLDKYFKDEHDECVIDIR